MLRDAFLDRQLSFGFMLLAGSLRERATVR